MNEIAYTVVCIARQPEQLEAWLAWLKGGHLADVCAAGALDGRAVKLDGPGHRAEACYRFASRQAFETYEREHAPRLREEGLKLFPPEAGFAYERRVGEIAAMQA